MLACYLEKALPTIERALLEYLPRKEDYPQTIHQAMHYSMFAGGKRIRPVMAMAACEAVGGNSEQILPAMCAIEMIHTYSLIHDDLPAMDDDDFRRGKLTNHKVFGEGVAILAGDALLTRAFEIMPSQLKWSDPEIVLKVWGEIACAAGSSGMIGGQVVDLQSEDQQIDPKVMEYIHMAKTGAMFKASVRSGAMLGGANQQQMGQLTQYADWFGLAFQITDDILDIVGTQDKLGKPVGSDIKNHKATYPSLYGLEQANKMAQHTVEQALSCISGFGARAEVLRELVRYLLKRDY